MVAFASKDNDKVFFFSSSAGMVTVVNYALRIAHVRLYIRSCVRRSNMETEWSSSISFQRFRNRFSYLLCALLMCTTKMMAYESYLWFCIRSWMLLLHFQYWINRKQFEENRVFYFFMTLSKNNGRKERETTIVIFYLNTSIKNEMEK